jgi:hypothetical protein
MGSFVVSMPICNGRANRNPDMTTCLRSVQGVRFRYVRSTKTDISITSNRFGPLCVSVVSTIRFGKGYRKLLIGAGPKAKFKLDVMKKSDSDRAFGSASTGRRPSGPPFRLRGPSYWIFLLLKVRLRGPSCWIFYRIEGLRRSWSFLLKRTAGNVESLRKRNQCRL